VFACLTLIATLCGFCGEVFWLLELTCHFRVQYLVLATVGAVALRLFRDFRWSSVAVLATVVNASLVVPCYFGRPNTGTPASQTFRILLSNVFTENTNSGALL
jgi:hypothetical protein